MRELTLRSPKWEGDIRLKFHPNGFLANAELPQEIELESAKYLATHFPVHIDIVGWLTQNTGVEATEVDLDISFEAFWNAYNQKRGSKLRAQQLWDGDKRTMNKRPITVSDRQDIMRLVKRYERRFKGHNKEFQPLASTFLNSRMWEAEMEAVASKRGKEVNLIQFLNERRPK